jgi:hypothetical protein
MAIAKAEFLKPLKPGQLSVNHSVLIIGGGLAGITAALSLADQGFPSIIVEKEAELGGNYRKLSYTLEGLDTKRHLAELLEKVEKNPLIRVFTGAEIKKIEGFIGNTRRRLPQRERETWNGVVIVATGAYELETTIPPGPSEKITQRAGEPDRREGRRGPGGEERRHDPVRRLPDRRAALVQPLLLLGSDQERPEAEGSRSDPGSHRDLPRHPDLRPQGGLL